MTLTPHWRALLWLLGYFVPRYSLGSWLDSLHPYAVYTFEVFYVTAFFYAHRHALRFRFKPRALLGAEALLALIFGGACRVGCNLLHIPFPLDLSAPEIMVLLLIVAPLLEEALYRQALLLPLDRLLAGNRLVVVKISALLFSASHFEALWTLRPELHGFVWYQGAYTLGLGLWLASAYYRHGGWGATLVLHFAFNLGFFVADRL
jgi:membrane protease YdiL (CAAX protease family)